MIVESRFKVGDAVAFAHRAQPGMPPFRIGKVDANMFDVRYQLEYDNKWWTEGCFMPYEDWKKK